MLDLRYAKEVRWLFQTALLVFLVTISLGMARGLGIIHFEDRNQFLTHLHSGAIGWVTLGIMASVLWLYGGSAPREGSGRWITWTSLILMASVPLYVLAWWTGIIPFRAITGVAVLLGIVAYVGWLVREAAVIGYRQLTTPQLGAVIGLVMLVVGSTIGVLLQIQFATGTGLVPGESVGAHAEAQISGYLILVAMSLAYWQLHGNDRTRRGTWMVGLFFGGGAIVAISLLANALEGAIAYLPLDIAAFIVLLTIVWRRVLVPGWFQADSTRHFAIAIPFALVFLGIFVYIIVGFVALKLWPSFEEIPPNLFPASVHPLFVGAVTNILFGTLFELNRGRREFWPWADHIVFWGISLAVAAFTLAILMGAEQAYAFITPVLGLSILVGIITHSIRLNTARAQEVSPSMAPS